MDREIALYVEDIAAALRSVKPMYEAEGPDGEGVMAWERCVEAIQEITPTSHKTLFENLIKG